jgi:hypothetical protein
MRASLLLKAGNDKVFSCLIKVNALAMIKQSCLTAKEEKEMGGRKKAIYPMN